MNRNRFLEIAALINTAPKEFVRIMDSMTSDEQLEYEIHHTLWLEEQEEARDGGLLH